MDKIRRLVFDSLLRMETEDKFANLELNATLHREGLSDVDRGFYTRLFYGVIERKLTLDYYIDKLSARAEGIDLNVRVILRLGLYQLMYMDKIPASAAAEPTTIPPMIETEFPILCGK